MYAEYNNNPQNKRVGDCVIRAIAKALEKSGTKSISTYPWKASNKQTLFRVWLYGAAT